MGALSASQIIGIWELGLSQHPVDRALTLLAAGLPESGADQLAALGLGERNLCLLNLRQNLFGPTMNAFAKCPRCTRTLEFTLKTTDLAADHGPVPDDPNELAEEGVVVRFRLPNSTDLQAVAPCGDVVRARRLLIERCVLEVNRGGAAVSCDALPEAVVGRLAARLAECDPLADITLDLECAECSHVWRVAFDIAAFLWGEIGALARRLMVEVHSLALAYGWSEADILAMSASRRQFYLEMAG